MINEVELRRQEREPVERARMRIYVVRHGEQIDYEDDLSPLTKRGVSQSRNLALNLIDSDLRYHTNQVRVRTIHSDKARTRQSATIIHSTIGAWQSIARKDNITLEPKIWSIGFLQTTGALTSLQRMGVAPSEAYREWVRSSKEQLEARGIKTHDEVSKKMLSFINTMSLFLQRLDVSKKTAGLNQVGTQSQLYHIWITHETALAALQLIVRPNEEPAPIDFMDPLIIDLGTHNGDVVFSFPDGVVKEIPSAVSHS